jgi:hypothetical protein
MRVKKSTSMRFLPFLHEYLAMKSKIIAVLKYGTLHGSENFFDEFSRVSPVD